MQRVPDDRELKNKLHMEYQQINKTMELFSYQGHFVSSTVIISMYQRPT